MSIQPQGSPDAYQAYRLVMPAATHRRPATCQEVNCANFERGWQTTLNPNVPVQAQALDWIRMHSGRQYGKAIGDDTETVTLVFFPGQPCFEQHTISLEREPIPLVQAGDYRAAYRPLIRRHTKINHWVEDFADHQSTIAERVNRG